MNLFDIRFRSVDFKIVCETADLLYTINDGMDSTMVFINTKMKKKKDTDNEIECVKAERDYLSLSRSMLGIWEEI